MHLPYITPRSFGECVVNAYMRWGVVEENSNSHARTMIHQVWALADVNQDGQLDVEECAVAMTLCHKVGRLHIAV